MIRSRATLVTRLLANAKPIGDTLRRNLAITPTVKVASDTSGMDFPAPSHVSISSEAADLAKQLADFYSNPANAKADCWTKRIHRSNISDIILLFASVSVDSVISIPDDARDLMQAEIEKKVKSIPDTSLPDDYVSAKLRMPSEIRLGDNPLFEAYNKSRTTPKLD